MGTLNANAYVSWSRLLSLLNIPTQSVSLPVRVKCPLCGSGRLTIFHDYACGGQWHHCHGCGQHGDMIELAAAVWKLSIHSTLAKLATSGFDFPRKGRFETFVADYLDGGPKMREAASRFWTDASSGSLFRSSDVCSLLGQLHWQMDATSDWRFKGVGRYAGSLPVPDLRTRLAAKGRKQGWKGKQWSDAIVFPFYDLPGRLSGFLGIAKNSEQLVSQFQPVTYSGQSLLHDSGLLYHPSVLNYKEPVLAFRDWRRGIGFAMKSMFVSSQPVSSVVWHHDPQSCTKHAWKTFAGRKLLFWSEQFEPETFAQAIMNNGFVVKFNRQSTVSEFFNRFHPQDILQRFEQTAVHWTEALDAQCTRMADHEVEDVLLRLNMTREELEQTLNRCSKPLRDRLLGLLDHSCHHRSVIMDKFSIEERPQGWFRSHDCGEELISDGVLRIDQVLWHDRTEQAYYRGRVLFRDKEILFCDAKDSVEADTFSWMQQLLLKNSVGVMKFNPSWSKKAVALALQFSEPEMKKGFATVGWDDETQSFVLPHYQVLCGGNVEPHTNIVVTPDTPGQLPLPGYLTAGDLQTLLEGTSDAFWVSLVALIANVVAPAVGQATYGIAVHEEHVMQQAKLAAVACGCLTYPAEKNAETVLQREKTNHWPIAVGLDNARRATWLRDLSVVTADSRNLLVRLSMPQALVNCLQGGWLFLVGQPASTPSANLGTLGQKILPAFLQYLSRQRFECLQATDRFLDSLLAAFEQWLRSDYQIQHPAVRASTLRENGLYAPPDRAERAAAFAKLVFWLVKEGSLLATSKEYGGHIWKVDDPYGYFVPKQLLLAKLEGLHVQVLPASVISESLLLTERLVAETNIDGVDGWVVEPTWWEKEFTKFRAKNQSVLHIA